MNDLMIDIETLGTTPNATILSIGAVWFDPHSDEMGAEFYCAVDMDQNRHIDPSTLRWWMQQSDMARDAVFGARNIVLPLRDALSDLSAFVAQNRGQVRPWSQGASFDIVLLEDAYRQVGIAAPWKFWDIRDTRTAYDMAEYELLRGSAVAHHALEDAKAQVRHVQAAFLRVRSGR